MNERSEKKKRKIQRAPPIHFLLLAVCSSLCILVLYPFIVLPHETRHHQNAYRDLTLHVSRLISFWRVLILTLHNLDSVISSYEYIITSLVSLLHKVQPKHSHARAQHFFANVCDTFHAKLNVMKHRDLSGENDKINRSFSLYPNGMIFFYYASM